MVKSLFKGITIAPSLFHGGAGCDATEAGIRVLAQFLKHRFELSLVALREEEWLDAVQDKAPLSKSGEVLLDYLTKKGRIVKAPKDAERMIGGDDDAWHREASRLVDRFSLCAFVQSESLQSGDNVTPPPRIAAIEAGDHINLEPSYTITPTADGWGAFLEEITLRSERIQVIDPYLDPRKSRYKHFGRSLADAVARTPNLEAFAIHFHCQPTDRDTALYMTDRVALENEWYNHMTSAWDNIFRKRNIRAQVTLWDDLHVQHNRYLLTERFGLFFSNGFDMTYNKNSEERVDAAFLDSDRLDELFNRHDYRAHSNESRCRGHFTFGAA